MDTQRHAKGYDTFTDNLKAADDQRFEWHCKMLQLAQWMALLQLQLS